MIDCQIGSGIRFFGSDPAVRRVAVFGKAIELSHVHQRIKRRKW